MDPQDYFSPSYHQLRSCVKPFDKRRKRFPVWVALLMFLVGAVGLAGLLVTIYE